MTTFISAPGRATAFGGLRTILTQRQYATAAATTIAPNNGRDISSGKVIRLTQDPHAQRELFLNVLNANATKRDAKQYLARFRPPRTSNVETSKVSLAQEQRNARYRQDQDRLDRIGVNLGGLYAPARAIADNPQFSQQDIQATTSVGVPPSMHVALVCLKGPEQLDESTVEGLAVTLSQLVKLDMRIVLVIQPSAASASPESEVEDLKGNFAAQAERLSRAIGRHSSEGARYVPGTLEIHGELSVNVSVPLPRLLIDPLKRGVVTIVPTLAHTSSGQLVKATTMDVMAALTKELSCLKYSTSNDSMEERQGMSLDRIIVLDAAGGIPSKDRGDGAHVFINLEQEFEDISNELSEYAESSKNGSASAFEQHQHNLRMLQQCLALLPSASSALIISPQEAASSSQLSPLNQATISAGTRRQKNTLIHNLLTNKPVVSSSLPTARFTSSTLEADAASSSSPTATLVKRGMPLSIIPVADRGRGWQVPHTGHTSLTLENDSRIDLPRLVHLIEDSFRRKLNVQHYLDRIRGRVAGIIVAGEYEGGAILTWEQPPGTSEPSRLVPYLDKFAVLQSSQGSSGVADIVFQAMVRSCFPNGVCWRSRKDNPVNKWYFERATSSWVVPGTQWTMFWTGKGVETDERRFLDYVSVCRNVVPSWADSKKPD